MKKEILLTSLALLVSAGIIAQVNTQPTQTKTQTREQIRLQDQTCLQTQDQSRTQKQLRIHSENHGGLVSGAAQNTSSNPGKGLMVREQARLKGDAQKAMSQQRKAAGNMNAVRSQRSLKNTGINQQMRIRAHSCSAMGSSMTAMKAVKANRGMNR